MAGKNKVWTSVDPLSAWKKKLWGWFHRQHSIILQLITESGLSAWLWHKYGLTAAVVVAACLMPATIFIVLERRYWIRELQTGNDFHRVCHFMRDEVARLRSLAKLPNQASYLSAYGEVHDKLANHIARYFQSATNDSTVNCAIRIVCDEGKGPVYKTFGRSIGMDEQRKDMSEPIPVDKGLARTLREDLKKLGVCHIRNIQEAVDAHWWMPCKTDSLADVRVVMAAPVNWYEEKDNKEKEKVMGGILYVTSRRDNLQERHVAPIKAFADLLGFVYPAVTGIPREEEVSSIHAVQ